MASDAQQQEQEQARKWGQVVAQAWTDEAFKQRLLAEPKTVLAEQGVELPAGLEVRVMEDTEQLHHLVLPPRPAGEGELSEDQLGRAAGGGYTYSGTYTYGY
jgi:hypothetical protein